MHDIEIEENIEKRVGVQGSQRRQSKNAGRQKIC